MVNSSKR